MIELSPYGAYGAGGGIRFLYLAKNLGLTDYHRIQTGSHAEQVADRIFPAEFVKVRIEFFPLQMKMIAQKSAEVGGAVGGVGHNLDAIAGGNHDPLFDPGIGSELAARVGQTRFRDRHALAHFERSAFVIHANELESHEAANLWMVEK